MRRGVHHLKIHNRHWVHTRGLAANITTRNMRGSVGKSCWIRHPFETVRKPFHQRLAMPYQARAWRSDTAKHHSFYFPLILFCTVHHKHGHATSCTKPTRTFIADEQLIVHSGMTSVFYFVNHVTITNLQLCRTQQATILGKQHCQHVLRSDQWNKRPNVCIARPPEAGSA